MNKGRWSGVAIAALALLAVAFLFGGASRQHELRLALVEIVALPLLVLASVGMAQSSEWRRHRFALAVLGSVLVVPLAQLLPLPPDVWMALPGRDQLALALAVTGLAPDWAPLTLAPDRTWGSFLALIPPVAMFLGVITCPPAHRVRLVSALLAITALSVLIAAAQLASGSDRLYPWRTTDAGSVVGLFANRNHLATLCLVALPFAALLGARAMRHGGHDRHRTLMWLSVGMVGLLIVALGTIRSRAGIVLLVPVLSASLCAAWFSSGAGRPKAWLLAVSGGAALALLAVCLFALGPILERFDTVGSREGRFENWPIVVEAANTYLPVGSGLGSFDSVFRSVEPLETLDATYLNQAHNEYLEIWLETGWLGIAALIAFLIWFGRRSATAWRAEPSTAKDLQVSASVAVAAILLHSLVDYPARTETIAVVLALCCALLETAVIPVASVRRDPRRRKSY